MTAQGEAWTVRRLLEWTTPFFTKKQVDSPRLSAELLLAHVMGVPRLKLYTDYDRVTTDKDLATYKALVQRAAEHEPIAYLTGKAYFFNLEFEVTRDVLIPRPDTETVVENVMQLVRNQSGMESPRVLDLCTGSGCIAAAVAANVKTASVLATDLSDKALAVARRNFEKLGLSGRVAAEQGDLFDALRNGIDVQPFHLVLANPPYIPSADLPNLDRNVRDYEPLSALDGGPDGLSLFRRIVAGAPDRMVAGGRLYLEIQFDQGNAAREIAQANAALEDVKVLKDYSGHDRVLTARKRGNA